MFLLLVTESTQLGIETSADLRCYNRARLMSSIHVEEACRADHVTITIPRKMNRKLNLLVALLVLLVSCAQKKEQTTVDTRTSDSAYVK